MALDKLTKIDSQTGIRTTADYTVSDLTVDTVTVKSGGIKMPVGMSTFQNVTVTGELTVEGTTTTLDTNLIGVDRIEVAANSDSVVGVAVTQSGSADILKLVGSGSTVVTVTTGGNILVGTTNEGTVAQLLSLYRANTSALELRTNTTGNSTIHFTDGDPPSGNASYRGSIVYDHRNDLMKFGTSATHRVWINSAGVGIGTTNPQVKLHILAANPVIRITDSDQTTDNKSWNISAGTANILRFQAIDDAGTSGGGNLFEFYRSGTAINQFRGVKAAIPWFVIDNNTRRVGIGTTIPIEKLEVTGNTVIGIVTDKTNYSNTFNTSGNGLGVTGVRALNIIDHNALIKLARTHNNYGSGIDFQHWNLDISTMYGRGLVGIESSSMYLMNTTEEGYIHFNTTPSGGSHTERVRIDSTGLVGIGTDNPTRKLHVFGDGDTKSIVAGVAGDALFELSNTGNGNFSGINFVRERSTGSVTGGSIFMPSVTADNSALLYLQTQTASAHSGVDGALTDNNGVRLKLASQPGGQAADTAFTVEVGALERFRIDADGQVAIGTNTTNNIFRIFYTDATVWPFDSTVSGAPTYTPYSNEVVLQNHVRDTTGSFASIMFRAGSDASGNKHGTARIAAVDTGDYKADLVSGTRNTTFAERLRIQYDGKVGIGTSVPDAPLHVHTSSGYGTIAIFGNNDNTSGEQYECLEINNSVATYPALSNQASGDTLDLRSLGAIQATIDSNANDPNTKYFRVSANGIGNTATELFRVHESGDVGIGTTGSVNKLHVYSDIASLAKFERTDGGWAKVDIKAGNNTGNSYLTFSDTDASEVGAINYEHADDSLRLMTYDGSNSTDKLRITGVGTVYMPVEGAKFGVSQDPDLTTMGATSGTWDLPEVDDQTIGAEMRIGDINSNSTALIRLASYGSGDNGTGGGAIMFTNTRCGSASHHSDLAAIKGARESLGKGYLRFFTASQAASTEKMRITSGGEVGIGTDDPGTPLHVYHATTNEAARFESGDATCYITFGDSASNTSATNRPLLGAKTNDLFFQTGGSERVRIISDGAVGINTDSPESFATLQINNHDTHGASQVLVRGDDMVQIILRDDTGATNKKCTTIRNDEGDLIIGTHNDGFGSFNERSRFYQDGRIIHTTNQSVVGLIVKNSDNDSRLQIYAEAANKNSTIWFGDADDDDIGKIDYDHNDNSLRFNVNVDERMRIDSSGRLLLGSSSETDRSISDDANALLQLSSATSPKMILVRDDTSIVSGNHLGLIDFHSIDAGPVRCARIGALAVSTHQSTDHATALVFETCADNSSTALEALRICHDGDIAINKNDMNTTTNAILEINSHDIQTKFNNDNTSQFALFIDTHFSGTEEITSNRTKAGIRVDMEYNGTGVKDNTSGNRNSLYGIHCTSNATKDTYTNYSGYFFAESNADDQEESTTIMGVYGYGRSYSIGGSNTTSTIYGGYFLGYRGGDCNAGHCYGVYARSHHTTNGSGKTGDMTAVYGECEFDEEDITNAYAFRGHMDRDAGTIANGYILYGSYSGDTHFTNRWGIYIGDSAKNYLNGDLEITGTFEKGTDNFRIPHPLVGLSTTKDLVHSVIEGPQMDLIYRGKTDLVAGISTINIDTKAGMTEGTFVALCRDIQCFTSNETGWTAVKGSVTGNKITIIAQDNTCTDTISWMVVGERQDDNAKSAKCTDNDGNLIVEPDKRTDLNDKYQAESEKNIYNIDPNHNPGDDPVEE